MHSWLIKNIGLINIGLYSRSRFNALCWWLLTYSGKGHLGQGRRGGRIDFTHSDVTRYWITLDSHQVNIGGGRLIQPKLLHPVFHLCSLSKVENIVGVDVGCKDYEKPPTVNLFRINTDRITTPVLKGKILRFKKQVWWTLFCCNTNK